MRNISWKILMFKSAEDAEKVKQLAQEAGIEVEAESIARAYYQSEIENYCDCNEIEISDLKLTRTIDAILSEDDMDAQFIQFLVDELDN